MPILEIEIVIDDSEVLPRNIAGKIADRAGKVFNSNPGHTWVRMRTLSSSDYAENDLESRLDVQPVFVSVLKSNLPEPESMASEMLLLTQAIAEVCNRPAENVHILYLPAAKGRMSFGGKFVSAANLDADRDDQ